MRTRSLTTALLAAGLLLVGCGGDGDDGSSDAEPTAASSSGASTATVTAKEFEFDPGSISLAADTEASITLLNRGVVEHDIVVDELDLKIHADPGERTTESVTLPAGSYDFYCSIPGHKEAGMEGTLTVE